MSSSRIVARLYEHVEPIDRGNRYEDPLQAVLDETSAGRVIGGGSQLNAIGGIDYAEIEIELSNLDDEALRIVCAALEQSGAPKGSELTRAEDGRVLREFGTHECLAIYLDAATLPDEVYANLDFDALVAEISTAAGPDSYHGFWQGSEETGIFVFGANADDMFARVEPVLRNQPIGQNARVVLRHGKKGLNPREVRMPRS